MLRAAPTSNARRLSSNAPAASEYRREAGHGLDARLVQRQGGGGPRSEAGGDAVGERRLRRWPAPPQGPGSGMAREPDPHRRCTGDELAEPTIRGAFHRQPGRAGPGAGLDLDLTPRRPGRRPRHP